MFLGTYTPKLDDKGRLTLPAKFRDALAGGVMVSKGQDFSLAVYTAADFAERSRKLTAASRANPKARAYVRQFFSGTDEQRPDGLAVSPSVPSTVGMRDSNATAW